MAKEDHYLTKRREFSLVWRKGRRRKFPSFHISVLWGVRGNARIGVSVLKKYGKAVRRNRLRRVVKEWFREERKRRGWERVWVTVRVLKYEENLAEKIKLAITGALRERSRNR